MQIHEITHSRVNEGILKGVANAINRIPAVAGAVASNIGGQILAKAGLDPNTGLGTTNPFGDKEAEAAKLAEPLIKNQAVSLQKQWAEADHSNPSATQQSLNRVLHNTLLQRKIGNDYTELNAWVDPDPAIQQRAATIEKQIETALKTIGSAGANADTASWEGLVRAATQAMQLISFHPKKYSASALPSIKATPTGWTIGNTVLSPNNPAHAPVIQIINTQRQQTGAPPKLKQTPQGLMIGSQLIGKNNPAFQALSSIINGDTDSSTPPPAAQPFTNQTFAASPGKKMPGYGKVNQPTSVNYSTAPATAKAPAVAPAIQAKPAPSSATIKGAKPGAPTPAEYAKLDQRLQQAMAAQGQRT